MFELIQIRNLRFLLKKIDFGQYIIDTDHDRNEHGIGDFESEP